jgi:hypothetical protein
MDYLIVGSVVGLLLVVLIGILLGFDLNQWNSEEYQYESGFRFVYLSKKPVILSLGQIKFHRRGSNLGPPTQYQQDLFRRIEVSIFNIWAEDWKAACASKPKFWWVNSLDQWVWFNSKIPWNEIGSRFGVNPETMDPEKRGYGGLTLPLSTWCPQIYVATYFPGRSVPMLIIHELTHLVKKISGHGEEFEEYETQLKTEFLSQEGNSL